MSKINSIGVFSAAKIFGLLYVIFGFVFGAIVSLLNLFGSPPAMQFAGNIIFGLGAILFFPIVYGILGFIFGGILAWLYNVISALAGGLEIDIE
ncbi:hypothetical protein GF323_01710 [Candidatus Woesearchaeota archaeon]|nr:hypothetical protein [Candidatus Woesearchaeota archaeon]